LDTLNAPGHPWTPPVHTAKLHAKICKNLRLFPVFDAF
jgi:hypothetical protein